MFFRCFFIHRTLHPGKIYPVKNNLKKFLLKSENLFFCLYFCVLTLHPPLTLYAPLLVSTRKKHVMWKNIYLNYNSLPMFLFSVVGPNQTQILINLLHLILGNSVKIGSKHFWHSRWFFVNFVSILSRQ